MELRIYFHLLSNYLQNNIVITIPHAFKKNSNNTFPFPTLQFSAEAVQMEKPKITDISKYC
jgi:hypothetical protein